MKDKVYIASGFFTPEALNKVIATEEGLGKEGIDFFSPRTVTADLSPNNPDREKNAKMLFDKDLEEIHNCNKMHAILDESYDQGTLFEIGYFFGLTLMNKDYIIDNLEIEAEGEVMEVMTDMLDNLEQSRSEFLRFNRVQMPANFLGEPSGIFIHNGNNKVKFILNLFKMNTSNVGNVKKIFNAMIEDNCMPIFVTDDRPVGIMLLMGCFKALGINYCTASTMNYGSNIMIASSSLGHINLPSIVNPYKTKVNIE